jgi:hypothetical protein
VERAAQKDIGMRVEHVPDAVRATGDEVVGTRVEDDEPAVDRSINHIGPAMTRCRPEATSGPRGGPLER